MWGSMSTCLVMQHVAPESAFTIEDALVAAGVTVDTRHVYAGDPIPEHVGNIDGLVVMGGPMSAASDQGFPTRDAELHLIAAAIALGIPTLGVCLGAQLMAVACGAPVYPGAHGSEIGWSTVYCTESCEGDQIFADLPERLTVLQWHGDTFDLPADAHLLMSNSFYPNQAFRIGDMAWGVQFHLEVDQDAVKGFLMAFASDAVDIPGGTQGVWEDTPAAVATLAPVKELVLGRFAGLVASGVTSESLVGEGRTPA
jgi:GMP synthase-like glutamine amidotransferase